MTSAWRIEPTGVPVLAGDAVHVWRLRPAGAPAGAAARPDELGRADRMRGEHHRSHFLCSRIWLRVILGRYLGVDPESVRFSVAERGKPSVLDGGDLSFSLSRSGGVALIALTRGRPVGVDVERIRADTDLTAVAERFFSTDEAHLLRSLPEPARSSAFYRLWVRKEAVVKASGAGLGEGVSQLDVGPGLVAGRWSVASLDAGADSAAAVAVDGAMGPISTWAANPMP